MKLPSPLREELDKRIRSCSYGNISEVFAWLRGEGVATSRSAVGRYAVVLRGIDSESGRTKAAMIERVRKSTVFAPPPRRPPSNATAQDLAQFEVERLAAELVRATRRLCAFSAPESTAETGPVTASTQTFKQTEKS